MATDTTTKVMIDTADDPNQHIILTKPLHSLLPAARPETRLCWMCHVDWDIESSSSRARRRLDPRYSLTPWPICVCVCVCVCVHLLCFAENYAELVNMCPCLYPNLKPGGVCCGLN